MRWKYLAAASAIVSSSSVIAQEPEIQIAPTPGWVAKSEPLIVPENAQGAVFYRKQDTAVHLTEEGQESYQGLLVRILQPQGLELGNVAISWNPASGDPTVHRLRILRGDRIIDILEDTSFEILRREDQLEKAMLDGLLTAVLRVPDLRIGDDLEIEFTVPSHDPTLGETSQGLLLLADSPPSGRFKLELVWAQGQEPEMRFTPDLVNLIQRSENRITARFDNPEVISPPRSAPPRYSWTRIIEFSDFQDWESVSRRFAVIFDEASVLSSDSPLRDEAAQIISAHPDKREQMQAALQLVQQQVRYVYVGLNGGNYIPASADETWERRYGDCKGKTAMLLALLDELGIEAEAVLVANTMSTDGLEERLANPGLFDHVLVRAKIEGETYWLDGTLPDVIEGRPDPFLPYQWVLPLSEEGYALERLPDKPFELPQEMGLMEIDARSGFDEPARIVHTIVQRGIAGLQQYYTLSSASPNQLEAGFRNQLEGSQSWDIVDTVSYQFDRETQASILTIIGSGPVDWEEKRSGRYNLTLPGGGFNPPSRRQRATDGESLSKDIPFYQAPNYSCYATTVRLPDDTDFENWGFNTVFDTMLFGRLYYRMMELREDRTLRMVRGSRVEDIEISSKDAERDNGRITKFDNSKAALYYDPRGMGEAWGRLRPVPATYEIDWTQPDVPCLPPDVLDE